MRSAESRFRSIDCYIHDGIYRSERHIGGSTRLKSECFPRQELPVLVGRCPHHLQGGKEVGLRAEDFKEMGSLREVYGNDRVIYGTSCIPHVQYIHLIDGKSDGIG